MTTRGLAAVDDDQLMARVQAGSVDAFDVLYKRFCDRAYRVARSVCRNDGRAADAVQEAFVAIWKSRDTYDPLRGTPAAWVLTVTRYRAIDIARRDEPHAAHRAGEEQLDGTGAPDSIVEAAEANDQARDLLTLLGQLPEAQREVITLAFYGQLTHTEIADHLGLPTGTVKGRMRLGLQRLRNDIEDGVG